MLFLAAIVMSQKNPIVWLDALDTSSIEQGWGKPQARKSVEGHPLTIAGQVFERGLGTHAESIFEINLGGGALRFDAAVGLDDETQGRGSVRFHLIVDGKDVADSPIMKPGMKAVPLSVSLRGAKKLKLTVDDGGDSIDYDHADWADARFEMKPGAKAPAPVVVPKEPTMKIDLGGRARPEFNGARVVGCSPGRPFFFQVPASGRGPLTFSAKGVPRGLKFEGSTGFLFGQLDAAGTYPIDVTVRGPKGADHRRITIVCGEHKLALTPPMGWNSWNVWGTTVTAARVKAAADSFTADGLNQYGYRYVNIDDAWEGSRDASGEIETNEKFGDMKQLADYVHSKGLRLGIYSSPGPKTCAGYEASYKHEFQDAATYAKWGIDYLKYDWCSYGDIHPQPTLAELKEPYELMRSALDASGRDIVFSLCQYGMGDVYKWGKSVGGNLWRTTGDITDNYASMSSIAFQHSEKAFGAGPGGWNDPDMLVVGKLGWGDHPHPTGLTGNEQIQHITMWSLLAAPLILGCDLTQLDSWTKALITNHDVIEIDQDPLGRAATRVYSNDAGVEVWSRPLWDGTTAVGLMNRARAAQTISVDWRLLNLKGAQPVRDLWLRRNLGELDSLTAKVPGHGAKLFRIGKMK